MLAVAAHDALICFALFLFRYSVFVQSQFDKFATAWVQSTRLHSESVRQGAYKPSRILSSRPPALMEIIKGLIPAISCTRHLSMIDTSGLTNNDAECTGNFRSTTPWRSDEVMTVATWSRRNRTASEEASDPVGSNPAAFNSHGALDVL
jgi:hypothetical protein